MCGLLQLPHEKIVIVTSPDPAVCTTAELLQSPLRCSAAPRPRCSCGGWSQSTSACSGSWTAVDSWQQSVRRRRPGVTQLVTCQHVLPPRPCRLRHGRITVIRCGNEDVLENVIRLKLPQFISASVSSRNNGGRHAAAGAGVGALDAVFPADRGFRAEAAPAGLLGQG